MKIDYIAYPQTKSKLNSKGDTLFHNDKTTILGDNNFLTWVYLKYESKYKFSDFKVDEIYTGSLASPDFTSNEFDDDDEYVDFISEGCRKNGVNFAGHYTVISKDCGAECLDLFIVDRIDGKIIGFPGKGDDEGKYGYLYQKDSKMIIANSYLFEEEYKGYYLHYWCRPELYVLYENPLSGNGLRRIE